MYLVLDSTTIKYEPDFQDFEDIILNIYGELIDAVEIVPRVETKLYFDSVSMFVIQFFKFDWFKKTACILLKECICFK